MTMMVMMQPVFGSSRCCECHVAVASAPPGGHRSPSLQSMPRFVTVHVDSLGGPDAAVVAGAGAAVVAGDGPADAASPPQGQEEGREEFMGQDENLLSPFGTCSLRVTGPILRGEIHGAQRCDFTFGDIVGQPAVAVASAGFPVCADPGPSPESDLLPPPGSMGMPPCTIAGGRPQADGRATSAAPASDRATSPSHHARATAAGAGPEEGSLGGNGPPSKPRPERALA